MIYNSLKRLETNFVEQKELLKFLKITSSSKNNTLWKQNI